MKRLSDYLEESAEWVNMPASGDDFAINIREECLLETHIVERAGRNIVIEADERMIQLLSEYGMLGAEDVMMDDIRRYGAVGSSRGMGYTLEEQELEECPDTEPDTAHQFDTAIQLLRRHAGIGEDAASNDPLAAKAADDAPVSAMSNAQQATTIDEGVMSEIAIELGEIADREDFDTLYDLMTASSPTGQMVQKIANDIAIDHRLRDDDHEELLERVMDYLVDEFGGQLDEAEYQGRKVALGKPMQGDVKKFKVYVKDPKTGNVKKVNFGDKTMRIKKSNPKRRKSFRARHNCANPGPRTKARYWSCRKW